MTVHPRVRTRGTPPHALPENDRVRVILYGPERACEAWIADLEGESVTVQIGHTVTGVVSALIDDPPPRPQVLVIDLDALSPVQVMELHQVREQGWCGTLVCTGTVAKSLVVSLRIEVVLTASDSLAELVRGIDHAKETRRMSLVSG